LALATEPCAFCKKNVVLPCGNSMSADRCSQMAPKTTVLPPAQDAGLAAVAAALEPAPATPATKLFTQDDAVALLRKASQVTPKSTEVQIGGDHYKTMAIQPLTYIQANELDFEEGNIVKYISRWRKKGGIQDLEKAHDMLGKKIEFEKAKAQSGLMEYLSGLFKSV
jgi:hypothetical protein